MIRYALGRVAVAIIIWWLDFSPLLPRWSRLNQDNTVIGQLRRRAIALAWQQARRRPDRFVLWVFGLSWPALSALRALRPVWRHGRFVKRATGKSRFRQWRECVILANTLNYHPKAYYIFRFFESAISPGSFVQAGEFTVLLVRTPGGSDMRGLNDKLQFSEECLLAGVPTPPIVAVLASGGKERWNGETDALPRRSLFLKYVYGKQGLGAERWAYDTGADQWMRRGSRLNHDEMVAYFRARGRKRDVLVQHAIENHPDIRLLVGDALCTVRILTYRDPGMRATFISAHFKIARLGSEVDNMHAGSLACAVDASTGELGVARGREPSDGEHMHHPETGVAIRGTRLSGFHAAVDLTLRAHEGLPAPWTVGWDVAITPDGPMIIEANSLWGPELPQAASGAPFSEDFAARLLAHASA